MESQDENKDVDISAVHFYIWSTADRSSNLNEMQTPKSILPAVITKALSLK